MKPLLICTLLLLAGCCTKKSCVIEDEKDIYISFSKNLSRTAVQSMIVRFVNKSNQVVDSVRPYYNLDTAIAEPGEYPTIVLNEYFIKATGEKDVSKFNYEFVFPGIHKQDTLKNINFTYEIVSNKCNKCFPFGSEGVTGPVVKSFSGEFNSKVYTDIKETIIIGK